MSGNFFSYHESLIIISRTQTHCSVSGLHYFLSILWALCLMFHAPKRIFWLIGVPFAIYLVDTLVEFFSKTYLIENMYFECLSDGACLLTFDNPPGFGINNASYVYIMIPWISKFQAQ